jgi:glycosyltransferase involved in cell wall biosynthesis
VCFFGAFGNQFDLETVVDASFLLEAENAGVRFVLCGSGERLKDLKARAGGSPGAIFPGWVDRAQIWSLMAISDAGIAPYRNSAGFVGNLPNKPIEYLAGGLPIISSLRGYLEEMLDRAGCGITYTPGSPSSLRDVIVSLMADRAQLRSMSARALALFESEFDAEKVYTEMIAYLTEVVAATRHTAVPEIR